MSDMINTSKCEKECIYGTNNNSDKYKIIVHCKAKNKDYMYGQKVPCDQKTKKEK